MQNLVMIAALCLSGLFISCAVTSAENAAATTTPNTLAALNKTSLTTPAHVTNTTKHHTTPAHVTNTTTVHNTTTAHVTNTTKHHTTPAHVTNTTAANHTTPAHVTNTTVANHTTPAHVTNTTVANHTTPAHVTNTTAANHTTTMHPLTTVLPTLSPNSSLPITGQYNVTTKNATCIKITSGIQLIVIAKPKNMYFNILPGIIVPSGKCGNVAPWINLNFKAGFLNFTFGQDGKNYYISEISTTLHSMNNLGNTYTGIIKNMKLFHTKLGHSYKCKSKQVVAFSTNTLQVLLIDTQLQAFNIPGGTFGKAEECFLDYRYVLPVAFGVVLAGVIILIIIVYLICRRRQAAGYQRI
ncbi:lysosome-associated membrane glycoprotein 3 isoform X2 [Amblyraja radiata]|uniref:lysosome-associated membrane glycoprotein 3 isoform X2 n=1 Tax=Amblyraja radiata TaxID=386614 RepID=UPI001403D7FE|nr:lysosome-associated membrane glycoprotein 3 isoform X2 [Amblyraja radiata]